MSVSYSAGVFFGACGRRESPIGEKLNGIVDRDGGTPAETEIPGVEIDMVGSPSTGEIWLTVQAGDSAATYGRDSGDVPVPAMLVEDPAWRPAIMTFLARLGASDLPVGWHFHGSAF